MCLPSEGCMYLYIHMQICVNICVCIHSHTCIFEILMTCLLGECIIDKNTLALDWEVSEISISTASSILGCFYLRGNNYIQAWLCSMGHDYSRMDLFPNRKRKLKRKKKIQLDILDSKLSKSISNKKLCASAKMMTFERKIHWKKNPFPLL